MPWEMGFQNSKKKNVTLISSKKKKILPRQTAPTG